MADSLAGPVYRTIQTCRGVAALAVVLFHAGGTLALPKYFNLPVLADAFVFGNAGVEFFFVLSGFIIAHVHGQDLDAPDRLPGYLAKRALRVYPTYWIIFAGVCLLALASPALRAQLPQDPWVLLLGMLLIPQDPAVVGGSGAPVVIVAWTLQYEILFYLLFAAAIVRRWLALLVVVVLVANQVSCLQGCSFPRSWFGSNLLLLFAFGAAVAWLANGRFTLQRPMALVWLALGSSVSLAVLDLNSSWDSLAVDRSIAYGVVFALLLFGLVQAEGRGHIGGGGKAMQLLGDSSYALYLVHFPLMSALCKLLTAAGFRGMAGAGFALALLILASICAGVAFHLWVEKPVMRGLRALLQKPVPREIAAPVRAT
jgi:exopolysaccharide production protein ExoZ